MVMLTHQPTVW